MSEKRKICFVVSTIMTVKAFLDNHIRELSNHYDVFIAANLVESDKQYLQTLPIKGYYHVGIERKIMIDKDVTSIYKLAHYFRTEQFYAIHSVTPKAGMITAIAGKMAGVENRIHIFTGQVWASRSGLMRQLLKSIDWLIATLNTHILVDGNSQREFLINQRVLKENKSIVLANGSIAGVDNIKFKPDISQRNEFRSVLNIKDDHIVFLFLGRLCRDKGIDELLEAFSKIQKDYQNAYLLLVGPDEENFGEKIKSEYKHLIDKMNFCFYGKTPFPEKLLNAGDVFCLPSYREGFGVSVIEASSTGLPAIVSDAYGLRDSVLPEVTGLVCKVKDVESLYLQMKYMLETPHKIRIMGANGRDYIQSRFNQKDVSRAWVDFYLSLGNKKG